MIKDFDDYNEIECPHCETNLGLESFDLRGLVTYWGEDGAVELECDNCEKTFFVEEHVRRYWGVAKTKEEIEE